MSKRLEKKKLNASSRDMVMQIQHTALVSSMVEAIKKRDDLLLAGIIHRAKLAYKSIRTVVGLRRTGYMATRHHEFMQRAYDHAFESF